MEETIQTYIFLDLETTGLPSTNYGETKITEISLVSVARNHFSDSSPGAIPRVLNKLTMCFHPQRFIAAESERITGLSNELLEKQRTFDVKVCDLLENFIMGEPQPVCLLAHNGYRFDFPLLQAHTKILGKPLPDSVLCSDTLHAFRELRVLEKPAPSHIPLEVIEPYSPPPRDEVDDWLNHSSTEICRIMDELEKDLVIDDTKLRDEEDDWLNHSSTEICRIMDELEKDLIIDDTKLRLDVLYGQTPAKRILPREGPPPRRRESVPQGPPSPRPPSRARRNLFGTPNKTQTKPSYKLENVYQHLFKKNIPKAHSAEGDTLAMLECIAAIGPPFHSWVLGNHRKLSNILKLW